MEGKYMLKTEITLKEIKKIFSTQSDKTHYLNKLSKAKNISIDFGRSKTSVDQAIIDSWDYSYSKDVIREMYNECPKYKAGLHSKEGIDDAMENWGTHNLGEFVWPFSAMNFDKRVVSINRMLISEEEKDDLIASEVIKFRRIKDINTMRNDYIEYLITIHNNNIIPTLTHRRNVDFYIDGNPYDQKVSKSVGGDFMNQYGDNYREIAIEHPELVAKSLYEHQDGERFDAQPRLYIVYLDADISNEQIEFLLSNIDFNTPYQIEFDYLHAGVIEHHETHCFIVLLHN